jgi:hypothetical protein
MGKSKHLGCCPLLKAPPEAIITISDFQGQCHQITASPALEMTFSNDRLGRGKQI